MLLLISWAKMQESILLCLTLYANLLIFKAKKGGQHYFHGIARAFCTLDLMRRDFVALA